MNKRETDNKIEAMITRLNISKEDIFLTANTKKDTSMLRDPVDGDKTLGT